MVDSRPGDAFQPGELLNNTYRIEALLGRGGTSDVYRARSEISGRLMALKVLKSEFSGNDDYLLLLTREEEMREIRHDAVVRYSECNRTQDGHVYLMMDYVEGPGLDRKMQQGPMSVDALLTVCHRVAEGLKAAHARNIVHRDLSPDNIILKDGDPAKAVIIDFGIAKDTNPGAETIVGNEFAGKYAYAAPEQLSGQSDARTDIYSLGALLLANYRGAPPDVGRNPMEVVERKGKPLDTEGVPEPLKTLIDRMTRPQPDERMQSAAEVLDFLDAAEPKPNATPAPEIDEEATVITPVSRPRPEPEPEPEKSAAPRPASPPQAPAKSRGGLFAIVAVVLIAAAGAGAYVSGALDGLTGPTLPVADPFSLVVEKPAEGQATAVGNVPSEGLQTAIDTRMAELGGASDLTLASGDIAPSWAEDVAETLEDIAPLDDWRLTVKGNRAQVTGSTSDEALWDRLMAAIGEDLPGALEGHADITYRPVFLSADAVATALAPFEDCGKLELPTPGATGYGPDTPITVTGQVAATETRIRIFDTLRELGAGRQGIVDTEVLNPTLCLVSESLPNAPSGDIGIDYAFGDSGEVNDSGRFFVGENPVIDVVLPADVTSGFLSVSILDVSGNVYHLLPNISREDNSVQALREGREGEVPVRVAFALSEAAGTGKLAFKVDDSALGKSMVIAIHSTEPLFDGLRPSAENAEAYVEALKTFAEANDNRIVSLDSRLLVTAKP